MSGPRKGLLAAVVAASLGCVLCAALPATALAVHYEAENISALKLQLHNHEVRALGFHPAGATGHVHASLNDGRYVTILYATPEQAQLIALARGEGTPVTVATAKTSAKKTVHHKLRYIAGGILVAVIIVVAIVLLVDRRRKLHETADRGGGGTPAPSSPGDSS
jgi:hypothetical protein